jgi:ABC-2 type transport system permease protein
MNGRAIRALVRNDIRLFFSDRRGVIIGVLVPIVIAAFFGYIFGRTGATDEEQGKLPIAVVDEDQSAVTRAIVSDLSGDAMLQVTPLARDAASEAVRKGKQDAAAVFPKGFGEQSVNALFSGRDKPEVELLVDPSRTMSARLVQGLLAQYSMQEISKEAFTGVMGRQSVDGVLADLGQLDETPARSELKTLLNSVKRLNQINDQAAADAPAEGQSGQSFGLSIPYDVKPTEMVAKQGTPYNGYAHSFAGMAVQFILFAGIDAGIVLLLLRQRGIWQRIRSAPIGKTEFVLARVLATALLSAFQLVVIYLAAVLIFGVRIQGSWPGFIAVGAAFCLLNAAFGLMLATLGRSATATRGIATMVMLLLVMVGGAWVPSFVFPQWLQQAALATPTRWAVDGLDAMTWRGLPFGDAVLPTLVLLGAALVCFAIAVWRFRWEE